VTAYIQDFKGEPQHEEEAEDEDFPYNNKEDNKHAI
jgi:hypothetical protein